MCKFYPRDIQAIIATLETEGHKTELYTASALIADQYLYSKTFVTTMDFNILLNLFILSISNNISLHEKF